MKVYSMEAAIFSALRRAHRNSPEYRNCLNNAKKEYFIPSKKGTQMRRVHFKCSKCGEFFSRKQVNVDHTDPVVPLTGKTTYDDYIKRLWCGEKGLAILCKVDHNFKSKLENSERRRLRKLKNEQ